MCVMLEVTMGSEGELISYIEKKKKTKGKEGKMYLSTASNAVCLFFPWLACEREISIV